MSNCQGRRMPLGVPPPGPGAGAGTREKRSRDASPGTGVPAGATRKRRSDNSAQTSPEDTASNAPLMPAASSQVSRDAVEIRCRGDSPHVGRLNVRSSSLPSEMCMSGAGQGYQTWPLRPVGSFPHAGPQPGGPSCGDEPLADAQAAQSHGASEQLEDFIAGCTDKPSPRLLSLLNVHGCESAGEIHRHILDMADALFGPSVQYIRLPLQEQQDRREETRVVVKLFYKTLEGQLEVERQRRPHSNLGPLLSSRPFRQSLFACCGVLTAVAYGTAFLDHLAVVEKLGITSFDLGRNIELLVQACPKLPAEFRQHLLVIEEEIIELQAWQAGSSLYNYVGIADRALRSLQAEPLSSGSSTCALRSSLPSKLALSMRGKTTPAFAPINDFFRKVQKLSTSWLREMQHHLEVTSSANITKQIILAMQFALYERTRLFYNRRVYQILLCAVYGVCKVNGLNLTFKELTTHYTNNVKGQAKVYTAVVLRQTEPGLWVEECGDIIRFYNKVFLPAMGNFLQNNAAECKEQGSEAAAPGTPPREDPPASGPLASHSIDQSGQQPCGSATDAHQLSSPVEAGSQACGSDAHVSQQHQRAVNEGAPCRVTASTTTGSKSTDDGSQHCGSTAKRQRGAFCDQEIASAPGPSTCPSQKEEGPADAEDAMPLAKRCRRHSKFGSVARQGPS